MVVGRELPSSFCDGRGLYLRSGRRLFCAELMLMVNPSGGQFVRLAKEIRMVNGMTAKWPLSLSRGTAVFAMVVGVSVSSVAAGAWAAIPDNDGTITGCVRDGDGGVRVIDYEAGERCRPSETKLPWNQQGPAGPASTRTVGGNVVTLQPGQTASSTASCGPNEVATGSGYNTGINGEVRVIGSLPVATASRPNIPIGWSVTGANEGTSPSIVVSVVVCAPAAS